MDALVDIFYYDFILSKIIEMYHENESIETIIPYLKLATVMSKKFRDDKITMDSQVYIKEIYVKIIQFIKHYVSVKNETKDHKSPNKLIECIQSAISELPELQEDANFLKLCSLAFAIYSKQEEKDTYLLQSIQKENGVNKNTENMSQNKAAMEKLQKINLAQEVATCDSTIHSNLHLDFIMNILDSNSSLKAQCINQIANFSDIALVSCLQTIKFGNPVMRKFSMTIKNEIDQEKSSNITGRESPGEKVTW